MTRSDLLVVSFSSDSSQQEKVSRLPDFPVAALPLRIRTYVQEAATAIGVPPDMVAVPLLPFAGAAIGNGIQLQLKEGFELRPILWTVVVAPPGSAKSPSLAAAQHGVTVLQEQALSNYQVRLREYNAAREAREPHVRDAAVKPDLVHYYTTDATTEAVGQMLQTSHGISVIRDELVGWVRSFDAYRSGKGGDRQTWLSLWTGSPMKIDRKTAESIIVPCPVVCVTGGIQPDMMSELADEAGRADGFMERMLWSRPNVGPVMWNESTLEESTKQELVYVFSDLDRITGPGLVRLSAKAKEHWVGWHDANQVAVSEREGIAAGLLAKMPLQVGRICLVLHCLEHLGQAQTTEVSESTLSSAIEIGNYFIEHGCALLGNLHSGRLSELAQRVARALDSFDGLPVSRTDLHKMLGGHEQGTRLTSALAELKVAGFASKVEEEEEDGNTKSGRRGEAWVSTRMRRNEENERTSSRRLVNAMP